jgi:hypothetical protein
VKNPRALELLLRGYKLEEVKLLAPKAPPKRKAKGGRRK